MDGVDGCNDVMRVRTCVSECVNVWCVLYVKGWMYGWGGMDGMWMFVRDRKYECLNLWSVERELK